MGIRTKIRYGFSGHAGIIDRQVFSIMILMVLVTTLVTPVWLKAVFKREGARSSA
jgi:hypothetical protein